MRQKSCCYCCNPQRPRSPGYLEICEKMGLWHLEKVTAGPKRIWRFGTRRPRQISVMVWDASRVSCWSLHCWKMKDMETSQVEINLPFIVYFPSFQVAPRGTLWHVWRVWLWPWRRRWLFCSPCRKRSWRRKTETNKKTSEGSSSPLYNIKVLIFLTPRHHFRSHLLLPYRPAVE